PSTATQPLRIAGSAIGKSQEAWYRIIEGWKAREFGVRRSAFAVLGFEVRRSQCPVLGSRFCVLGSGFSVLGSGFWVLGSKAPGSLRSRVLCGGAAGRGEAQLLGNRGVAVGAGGG